MLISIVTPTYNSEKNVIIAAKSILKQTYDNFEHIIIDNLSDDNTINLIRNEYIKANKIEKLRIVQERDEGISDAFNKGINLAKGEIVGILNSDDSYLGHDFFARLVEIFKNDKILIVHGNIYFKDEKYGSNIRKPLQCSIQTAMPYNHPGMFIRKSVYLEYGLYDLNFKVAMDYELICRFKSNIANFEDHIFYLDGESLAVMNAGGASWTNELEGIKEGKYALKKNDLWDNEARKHYLFRILRVRIKACLKILGLNSLVKYWRNFKWRNN